MRTIPIANASKYFVMTISEIIAANSIKYRPNSIKIVEWIVQNAPKNKQFLEIFWEKCRRDGKLRQSF